MSKQMPPAPSESSRARYLLGDGFKIADDILRRAVQGISDLITIPGEISLEFADVKTILHGMGG